jgi:hypothetical protein
MARTPMIVLRDETLTAEMLPANVKCEPVNHDST